MDAGKVGDLGDKLMSEDTWLSQVLPFVKMAIVRTLLHTSLVHLQLLTDLEWTPS